MSEKAHLAELIAQQTDPVAQRLLAVFAKLIRDPLCDPADQAAQLRRVMDELFTDEANAAASPYRE